MLNLTIYPPLRSIAFYVFNFPVHYYGIIISIAIFLGLVSAYYLIKKVYSKTKADLFLDFSPMVIIYSIIGARLFYIIGDFKFYFKNPTEILMINHGGLSIWGAIIFAIISLYCYSKKLKFDFLLNLDIFSLFVPLCQAIGRLGNYINQEAYGRPYSGILKYFIYPEHRYPEYKNIEFYHPTFLYEMVLDILLFIFLFYIFKKQPKKGTITALYLIFYGIIRIAVESIRIDSVCYLFHIPVAIIISTVAILTALVLLYHLYNNKQRQ